MRIKHFTNAYISIFAALLCALGSITIGFSTWVTSVNGDTKSTSGNINADSFAAIQGVTVSSSSVVSYGHYFYEPTSNTYTATTTIDYSIAYDGNKIVDSSTTNYVLTLNCFLSFGDGSLPVYRNDYITAATYNSNSVALTYTSLNISFTISETITNNTYSATKHLIFTLSNKMIAKYGDDMNGKSFYLSLEVA